MASLSIIESTSAIACCSEIASTSSSEDVQEVINENDNNNTQFHTQMDVNSPFPRRQTVNIAFRNLKYGVNKLNFSKRRFGKSRWERNIREDVEEFIEKVNKGNSSIRYRDLFGILSFTMNFVKENYLCTRLIDGKVISYLFTLEQKYLIKNPD